MNPHLLPDPERWSERAGGTSAEDAIGASLRRVRAATEPSGLASTRLARIAMAPTATGSGPRLVAAGLAATLLIGGGAAAGVAWHAALTNTRARAQSADAHEPARARHAAHRRAMASPAELPAAGEPAPGEAPVAAEPAALAEAPRPDVGPVTPGALPVNAPAPVPASNRVTAPKRATAPGRVTAPLATPPAPPAVQAATEPPPLAPVPPADEAQLVARAFRSLRTDGDAAAAIAALDEHDRRFGAGALTTEATLARVEALLVQGRTAEALPPLLAIRGTPAGRTAEVRAARAELLARADRCDEAAPDLDALLAPGAPAAPRERALYARASCVLQGGDPARARADLERYLSEFPDGHAAAAVRAALARLRRP
jgi:TolA-binding protein